MMGIPGGPELMVIVLLAVLLFGADKIPKIARSIGESKGELEKGIQESKQQLNETENNTSTHSGEKK